jgi:hypothetical protein
VALHPRDLFPCHGDPWLVGRFVTRLGCCGYWLIRILVGLAVLALLLQAIGWFH